MKALSLGWAPSSSGHSRQAGRCLVTASATQLHGHTTVAPHVPLSLVTHPLPVGGEGQAAVLGRLHARGQHERLPGSPRGVLGLDCCDGCSAGQWWGTWGLPVDLGFHARWSLCDLPRAWAGRFAQPSLSCGSSRAVIRHQPLHTVGRGSLGLPPRRLWAAPALGSVPTWSPAGSRLWRDVKKQCPPTVVRVGLRRRAGPCAPARRLTFGREVVAAQRRGVALHGVEAR